MNTKADCKFFDDSYQKRNTMNDTEKPKSPFVPKLRFPEFRDAGEWEVEPLGNLLQITSSKRVHESDWTTEGVPFYRAREIVALYNRDPIAPLFISEELYRENAQKCGEIAPGDLLVTGVGSIGVPYLVQDKDRFYFKDGNIIWLKNRDTKLLSQFLYLLYESQFVQKQIKTMAGIGTVGTYTIDNANKTFVVFPTNKIEQQRIADCLSTLDDLIAAQARRLGVLQTHKKGLMQQLFPRDGETIPRLRFPEFRDVAEWEEKKLGETATFYNGRAYKQEELLEQGKYKVLRVGNFFTSNSWYYSDLELDDTKYCDTGDLLYAWSASFGPRIWMGEKTIYHYHIWKVVESKGIDRKFLFISLENETKKIKSQSANGLGLLHITKGTVENWKTYFPKDKEQQKIADCLSSINELIAAQNQKLDALKNQKKGLLQQLFPTLEEA